MGVPILNPMKTELLKCGLVLALFALLAGALLRVAYLFATSTEGEQEQEEASSGPDPEYIETCQRIAAAKLKGH